MAEFKPDEILHTITSDLIITTDVDDLVEIVHVKKEISMSDAAKDLKVSLSTIEAWAGFLEEEGIIAIKYKLTTPYLIEKSTVAKDEATPSLPVAKDFYAQSDERPTRELKLEVSTGPTKMEKKLDLKPIEIGLELTKNLNRLLDKAYDFIEKGDFDKAKQIYSLIKQDYEELPTDFIEMKRELEKNLTKLNKDLMINLHKESAHQAKLLTKLISSEIRRMKLALMQKDIKKAELIFKEVEQLYSRFPQGFVIKKTALQNQILDAYKSLVRHKHSILSRYVDTKSKVLEELVQQTKTYLNQNNLEKAFANYEKLRAIYNKIPKGFMQDRPALEQEIVQLLLQLMSNKHTYSANITSRNTQQINQLMSSTNALLARGEVLEANKQYKQLKKLYDELPAGFLSTKIALEEKILGLHQKLTSRLNREKVKKLNIGTKRINNLLKKAKLHLKASDPEIAEGVHREIEHIYSALPEGFLQHKTALKIQILDLYREILLKADQSILKSFDESADKKFKQVVHLIVRSHQFVENAEFEMLEPEYQKIMLLYGHLPYSLVQQKTKLGQEVKKLQNLVNLYKHAKQLDKLKNRPSELNLLLKQTEQLYNSLLNKYPGDENLFIFVKQKIGHCRAHPVQQPRHTQRPQPQHAVQSIQPKYYLPAVQHAPKPHAVAQAPKPRAAPQFAKPQVTLQKPMRTPQPKPVQIRSQPATPRTSTPTGVKELLTQANSEFIKNNMSGAKALYQKALSIDPSNAIAKSKLALIKQQQSPSGPDSIYKKSISSVKQTQPSKPKVEHHALKDLHTKSIDALYVDAKRYNEQKDYHNTTLIFREIKRRDPNFKDIKKLLHNAIREQSRVELNQMLTKLKSEQVHPIRTTPKVAVQPVSKPVPQLTPEPIKPVERKTERVKMLTKLKLKNAKELVQQNRMREAKSVLESLLRINPDNTEAKSLLEELKTAPQENLHKEHLIPA